MSDLIDRQAALDALRSCQTYLFDPHDPDKKIELRSAECAIEDLPAVQPDHNADIGKKVSISRSHEDDLISRQAAIEAMGKAKWAKERLEQLPPAQPEQKRGKWIYNSPVTMKCDQCGFAIKDWDWHRFKICPNCGADMRGGA